MLLMRQIKTMGSGGQPCRLVKTSLLLGDNRLKEN
jgi:hypothetical protein